MAQLGEVIRSGGDSGNLPSQMDTATTQLHLTVAKPGCESKLPLFFFFFFFSREAGHLDF